MIHDRVFVRLQRDEGGFPPWEVEEFWAIEQGPGRFIVDSIPTIAPDLSHRDVVGAIPEDDRWIVTTVLERGGHSTVNVVLFKDDAHDELLALGRRRGCVVEHTEVQGYFSIDVPPKADFDALVRDLEVGSASGKWDYRGSDIADDRRSG